MISSVYHIIIAGLLLIPFTGCRKEKTPSEDIGEIEKSDAVPDGVKKLVKAVAERDPQSFAKMISYPLSRPYPLHDIESEEEMQKYYSVMVDDSLRHVMTGSHPEDWEENGWRGWSLKNGEYVWLDSDLYDIPYLSAREKAMRDSLSKAEIQSIEKDLRDGWAPEFCLRALDDGTVFRVDSRHDTEGDSTIYRLASYPQGKNLSGKPASLLTGGVEIEGSAATATFHFAGLEGVRASYEADVPDGSTPEIEFTAPDGTLNPVKVKKIYWLDLISAPQDRSKPGEISKTPVRAAELPQKNLQK